MLGIRGEVLTDHGGSDIKHMIEVLTSHGGLDIRHINESLNKPR